MNLEGKAATGKFKNELVQFQNLKLDATADIEVSIQAGGEAIVISDGRQVCSFTLPGFSKGVFRTTPSKLFVNPTLVTSDRWPNGLPEKQRSKGLRLEMLVYGSSIKIVSIEQENEWNRLSPEEQDARERAQRDPKSNELEDVLRAMREDEYLRVHDSSKALVNPYRTAYGKVCSQNAANGTSETIVWKLGQGKVSVGTAKDVKAIASFARKLACEKGGRESDVLDFEHMGSGYIGMTRHGYECWQRVLKNVRSILSHALAPISFHPIPPCLIPSHPIPSYSNLT